jgi:hypothetical protein
VLRLRVRWIRGMRWQLRWLRRFDSNILAVRHDGRARTSLKIKMHMMVSAPQSLSSSLSLSGCEAGCENAFRSSFRRR